MKQRLIAKVKPMIFENSLVLSLSAEWIHVFSDIPQFLVSIDRKGHLVLQSGSTVKTKKVK